MKKKFVKLKKDIITKKFAKLHKANKEIKTLDSHLKKKGFRPQKEKKNFWALRIHAKAKIRRRLFQFMCRTTPKEVYVNKSAKCVISSET